MLHTLCREVDAVLRCRAGASSLDVAPHRSSRGRLLRLPLTGELIYEISQTPYAAPPHAGVTGVKGFGPNSSRSSDLGRRRVMRSPNPAEHIYEPQDAGAAAWLAVLPAI